MKYCCLNHQREGSCYFEFQPGQFSQQFWGEASIYLSMDWFDRFGLKQLFAQLIPSFDYYGITPVTRDDWAGIVLASRGTGAEDVVDELHLWVSACFQTEDIVTILGI